jgi:hypothetical protein
LAQNGQRADKGNHNSKIAETVKEG